MKPLQEALVLLQRAFIVNKKTKIGLVHLYSDKNEFINRAIALIAKHQLPIKYGWGADEDGNPVVYFEYCGKQVSFHDPQNKVNCKKQFNGSWIEKRQTRSPFAGLIKRMS